MAISAGGDVLVYGYEDGLLGVENIEPAGVPRGFVERMPGHRPGWRWQLQAPDGGVVDAVHVREDGTVQLTGRVREAPPIDERAQFQLLIGELDGEGGLVDDHQLGDRPSERPRQIASSNGWNVVAGYHDVYVPTSYVASAEDPFIVTWRDGGLTQARMTRFQTSWADVVDGTAIDRDGRVTVAGTAQGFDTRGAFVRQFDAHGDVLATTWVSRGYLESLATIRLLPDGDFIVAGSTWMPLDGHAPRDGVSFRAAPETREPRPTVPRHARA